MANKYITRFVTAAATVLPVIFAGALSAATTVYTVPFQASAPAVPHSSWKNNPVILKGSVQSPISGHSYSYYWDAGDGQTGCGTAGSPLTASGTPQGSSPDAFSLGCSHTYNSGSTGGAATGLVYTATLYVKDTTAGDSSYTSAPYYTQIYALDPSNSQGGGHIYNLPIEVNNAIDNGLWYAHTHQYRYNDGSGNHLGSWSDSGFSGNMYSGGYGGMNGVDCNAFEVSGFLPTNSPVNPYSDDVQRCLNKIVTLIGTMGVPSGSQTEYIPGASSSTYIPDQNGNGIAAFDGDNTGYEIYMTGMLMDALVSAGQPNTVITHSLNGALPTGGTGPGSLYSYKDLVFDLVDFYAYCQGNQSGSADYSGAWLYSCSYSYNDNSSSQWAAIGIIPAVRSFGAVFSRANQRNNESWLSASQNSNGSMNYYYGGFAWGPYATTPSGTVQMAMDGIGKGGTLAAGTSYQKVNAWDDAESFMRDNFNNNPAGGAGAAPKAYLYGLFSFTKGMLLQDNSNGGGSGPTALSVLHTTDQPATGAYADIDWYAAQSSTYGGADPTDGVARWLVSIQNSDGSWYGHNYTPQQYPLETGISITMLNKTVYQAVPVACATPQPASISNGASVTLDGSCSYDQNAPTTNIVTWQWNTTDDNSGAPPSTTFNVQPGNAKCQTASCVKMAQTFTTAHSLPYTYPVRLRVTNNLTPTPLTADVVTNITITTAPKPPTAVIGGPYSFCPSPYTPWTVNGSGSSDPNGGAIMITSYAWDFNGANTFTDATGAVVDATSAFETKVPSPALGGTTFSISLKVTNNEPTPLSSIASTSVTIHNSADAPCSHCVTTIQALPKSPVGTFPAQVQLYWFDTNSVAYPIDHYNVYRATNLAFNQNVTKVAGAGSGVPPIPVPGTQGAELFFADTTVAVNQQYYYRVSPATVNDTETCTSLVSVGAIVHPAR